MKCVLTGKLSNDLVADIQTGYVYDKAELDTYLEFNDRCPVTDRLVKPEDFIPVKGYEDQSKGRTAADALMQQEKTAGNEVRASSLEVSRRIARELLKNQLLEDKLSSIEESLGTSKEQLAELKHSGIMPNIDAEVRETVLEKAKFAAAERKAFMKGVKSQHLDISLEEFLAFKADIVPGSIHYLPKTDSLVYLCQNNGGVRLNLVDLLSKMLVTSFQLNFGLSDFLGLFMEPGDDRLEVVLFTTADVSKLAFDAVLNQFVIKSAGSIDALAQAKKILRVNEALFILVTPGKLYLTDLLNINNCIYSLLGDIKLAEAHPDGRLLALVTESNPGSIILFDIGTGAEVARIRSDKLAAIESVFFSNCGYYMGYAGNGGIAVVDLRKNKNALELNGTSRAALGFDSSGLNLAVAESDNEDQCVVLYNVKSGKQSARLTTGQPDRFYVDMDNGTNPPSNARSLVEEYTLDNTDFFDPMTVDLKDYLEELEDSLSKDSEDIVITTSMNADKSYTTGNKDHMDEIDNLVPDFDMPVRDMARAEMAKKHHTFLETVIQVFSPDPFSEDPRMFLGDHAAYFKIVKKRSMFFYYISRLILYLSIFYIIVKFLNRKKDETPTTSGLYNKSEHNAMMWIQASSIWLLFIGAGVVFYMIGNPKSLMDNAGSTLTYNFREINITSHEISKLIDEINAEKIKVPNDQFGFFSITNIIKNSLKNMEEDVETSQDFSTNMLKNPHLTSYFTPISLFFFAMILAGLSSVAYVNKNSSFQIVLFLISSLCLSYLIYNTGMYFSNFSGLHDICDSIIKVSDQERMPEKGMGLIKFVGCTAENIFFQQLIINLKAQNASLKLFNNELYKIKREFVHSAKDAVELPDYLNRLDANNVEIKTFAELLKKNEDILTHLMTINKCNKIKSWLNKEEHGLCYDGSVRFLYIFWIYLSMIVCYLVLMYTALRSSDILEKLSIKKIVKKHTFDKARYANDVKAD